MEIRTDRRYGETHEWYREDGGQIVIGVTEQGQDLLGDVVFVELPKVGDAVTRGGVCATLESVKAASDVICPVDGRVVAVNDELESSPELINDEPLDGGWIVRIEPDGAADEWMSADDYQAMLDAAD